jgi:hypothetical protein
MPRKEAEPKIESPDEAAAAVDVADAPEELEGEAEGGTEGEAEGEAEGAAAAESEPKKRSHHKKINGQRSPSETRAETREPREPRGRKGSLVDDFMKSVKKMHPAYWVLGLGGAALAIDYFMEGDKSVASSLYRGIFGGKAGSGEGGDGAAQLHPFARVAPMVMPGSSYAVPYYPAFPPSIYAAPRYPGYAPGFGGRPGFGYGRMGGLGYGYGGHGHAHVRGEFPWE